MKQLLFTSLIVILVTGSGCGQSGNRSNTKGQLVGGRCEGCEAVHESPVPFDKLSWTDTLPDFNESGPKMVISGIIYKADGKTPAKDVVLYIYTLTRQEITVQREMKKAGASGMVTSADG